MRYRNCGIAQILSALKTTRIVGRRSAGVRRVVVSRGVPGRHPASTGRVRLRSVGALMSDESNAAMTGWALALRGWTARCRRFVLRAALCCAVALTGCVIVKALALRTTWDGVYTEDQAQHGAGVYQARCGGCHGSYLEGDEDAPPLAGSRFSLVWTGRSLRALHERIQARMPKDAPGSLSRDDYIGVVAYMLSRNGFPSGADPLPSDREALAEIGYRAVPP